MEIIIREAQKEDAQAILELSRIFGSETDNLTFGEEGLSVSVEQEEEYLLSMSKSEQDVFYIAFQDGEPVGMASYSTCRSPRMSHRGTFGISVRKSAWGLGIGSILLEKLLYFAKNTAKADIVSLEVRSDNERAIRLYKKFGFEKTGCFKGFFKIHGELIDFDLMEKFF